MRAAPFGFRHFAWLRGPRSPKSTRLTLVRFLEKGDEAFQPLLSSKARYHFVHRTNRLTALPKRVTHHGRIVKRNEERLYA
jgi:hypothetical protein